MEIQREAIPSVNTCIFNDDLKHAGWANNHPFIQLHCHLDLLKSQGDRNTVYIPEGVVTPSKDAMRMRKRREASQGLIKACSKEASKIKAAHNLPMNANIG